MDKIYESIKSISVYFAEWLQKNQWVKRVHTHPKYVGKYWSEIHCEYLSIGELYDKFYKELNNVN
jgi:hypothetical protein